MNPIDTDSVSEHYRHQAVDHASQRVLLTNFRGTLQEQDLSEAPNCGGFGRLRHFRRVASERWIANPLPIDPALVALSLPPADRLRTQLFQNAVCNWRCWYCFVPFNLLSADASHSAFLSADELLELYLREDGRPTVIVLSGGQPDLIPEWTLWMLEALARRKLDTSTYVWTDDNLSNDYLWRFLSDADRRTLQSYRNLGRVCCFKGFDDESFAFNTAASPTAFGRQFELFGRLLRFNIDLYAYVTITTPTVGDLQHRMERFVDRLQDIHELLPLRTVPLEVTSFGTVTARSLGERQYVALEYQYAALDAWRCAIASRFPGYDFERACVVDIALRNNDP